LCTVETVGAAGTATISLVISTGAAAVCSLRVWAARTCDLFGRFCARLMRCWFVDVGSFDTTNSLNQCSDGPH
jgi:hypothetical protein